MRDNEYLSLGSGVRERGATDEKQGQRESQIIVLNSDPNFFEASVAVDGDCDKLPVGRLAMEDVLKEHLRKRPTGI